MQRDRQILYSPLFLRLYSKLTIEQRMRVDRAIDQFEDDPNHPRLHTHKLKESKRGLHSFSAGYDLRILYEEVGDKIVLMLQVGTHDKVLLNNL